MYNFFENCLKFINSKELKRELTLSKKEIIPNLGY